jgi:hypothetical protein
VTALRLRLANGLVDDAAIDASAATIDEAAQKIGKVWPWPGRCRSP